MQFDRMALGKKARELGFVRDAFEKVCRLAEVLDFIQKDALLSKTLALKGGTAINLTIFNLPRLSVDIDMDLYASLPCASAKAQNGQSALAGTGAYCFECRSNGNLRFKDRCAFQPRSSTRSL